MSQSIPVCFEIDESGSEDYRYTGKHEDPSGLYYFGARYYDPLTGRFTTRDTVFGDLSDPQSQNRYVYCRNNPQKYIDSDGKQYGFFDLAGITISSFVATTAITPTMIIGGGLIIAAGVTGYLTEQRAHRKGLQEKEKFINEYGESDPDTAEKYYLAGHNAVWMETMLVGVPGVYSQIGVYDALVVLNLRTMGVDVDYSEFDLLLDLSPELFENEGVPILDEISEFLINELYDIIQDIYHSVEEGIEEDA